MKSATKFLFPPLAVMTLLGAVLCGPGATSAYHSNPTGQAARVGSSVSSSLDKIVECFRKIIILLDDDASLSQEELARCVDVARKIHQEKQELLDDDVDKNLGTVTSQNDVKLSANSNVAKRALEAGHLLANIEYVRKKLEELKGGNQL
jgi:hypothetical protein